MESSLFIVMFLVFFVKGSYSETAIASRASNSGATCGPLLDNILRLERTVMNMSSELEFTKTEMKKNFETTYSVLKTTKTDLKTAIDQLETTKNDLVSTKTALKSTEQKLASALSRLTLVDTINDRVDEIANITEKLGLNREISFQVKQIKRPYTPSPFEPLKFDDVTLNIGAAYNPTSGIFIVPITGSYLCWANMLAHQRNSFALALMKEGKQLVRGYTGHEVGSGTATVTYLMRFNKGDHVWFAVSDGPLSIGGDKLSSYGCHLM